MKLTREIKNLIIYNIVSDSLFKLHTSQMLFQCVLIAIVIIFDNIIVSIFLDLDEQAKFIITIMNFILSLISIINTTVFSYIWKKSNKNLYNFFETLERVEEGEETEEND